MQMGIFSRTFIRPTLDQVLDAVQEAGLGSVQFNFTCAGLPAMPDQLDIATCEQIRAALAAREIKMAAVSGTFNMIDPNLAEREAGLNSLGVIASRCAQLGTDIVTLCTGTRNPDSMWRHHPDNSSPEAWQELIQSMTVAVQHAEAHNVTLVVEPEVSNVVDSAQKARRLLDEIQSNHLKIVIDGANLFPAGQLPRMREILDEAFNLLGDDIVMAHAKDLSHDGEAGHEAAGTGLLDYDYYVSLLRQIGFQGGLVLHSVSEEQVPQCVAFLREKLAST